MDKTKLQEEKECCEEMISLVFHEIQEFIQLRRVAMEIVESGFKGDVITEIMTRQNESVALLVSGLISDSKIALSKLRAHLKTMG